MLHGAYGNRLGRSFRVDDPPTLISETSPGATVAVSEMRVGEPGCGMTGPLGKDEAYLICLNIEPQRGHELWYGSHHVCSCDYEAGTFYALDLRRDPITYIGSKLHTLFFYLPRRALLDCSVDGGEPGSGELTIRAGGDMRDPFIESIGRALLPLFHREVANYQLLVDHLLRALCAYVACNYAGRSKDYQPVRGALAPWQQRLVKQMMRDRLAEGVSINELAEACGLSAGALFRGFKKSAGMSPHQWLLCRRIDAAIDFMGDHDIPLSQIAFHTGFSDQSHFSRIFTQIMGVSPGAWRKSMALNKHGEAA